jgi:hypothetical protein
MQMNFRIWILLYNKAEKLLSSQSHFQRFYSFGWPKNVTNVTAKPNTPNPPFIFGSEGLLTRFMGSPKIAQTLFDEWKARPHDKNEPMARSDHR